jgi:CubicO group peptidase (beta-lactamase class C family)
MVGSADLARHLLPTVRISGEDTRWTVGERLAHYKCPAAGVAVVDDGLLAWADGYGNLGTEMPGNAPADADTIFMGASCSKPVAAMLVLQHVERGIVDLDADVNRYLKRWQVPQNEFTAAGGPVTLRRMLSHTAGLSINGWPVIPYGKPVPTVIDILEGRPPSIHPAVVVNKQPGTTHRYSGGGYLLAQMLIEDQTGRTFADLADEFIFSPLGMTRTSFHQPLPERLRSNVAGGHTMEGTPITGGWMVSVDAGAGGLFTTALDYARFQIGCRDAWLGRPGAILTRSLAQDMMTRQGQSTFGLGWEMVGDGDEMRFNHGGSNDGYQCETDCYLESGRGGSVFTNGVSGIFLYREILNGIADLYDWPGYLLKPKMVQKLSPQEQDRYIGTYRITTGIELPHLFIFRENGKLYSHILGIRHGVSEFLLDENGRGFTQRTPFESHISFGPDGRAHEIVSMAGGTTEILRAVRTEDVPRP